MFESRLFVIDPFRSVRSASPAAMRETATTGGEVARG